MDIIASPIEMEYEIRSVGESAPQFTGYAAVFNSDSEPLPFIETIQPGAFARSIRTDRGHTFVVDHDDTKLLASTYGKTLKLSEDSKGLLVEATLPNTSYARDLIELHSRGEARHMSFTFRVAKTSDNKPGDTVIGNRRLLTAVKLGHVSVLTGLPPAYRQTTANIRSLAHTIDLDADALSEAIEDMREGKPLEPEAVAMLQKVIGELRTQPETVIEVPADDTAAAPIVVTMKVRDAEARLATLA